MKTEEHELLNVSPFLLLNILKPLFQLLLLLGICCICAKISDKDLRDFLETFIYYGIPLIIYIFFTAICDLTERYIVTNINIIYKNGIFIKDIEEIRLLKIEGLKIKRSF